MEQVPQWLLDSVAAAGMTAYAEDIDSISNKNGVMEADSATPTVPPDTVH
jgi:hypothetical protein